MILLLPQLSSPAHSPLLLLPQTLLGRRELPYEALVGPDNLEANPQTGFSSWKRVYEAVASGRLRLKDQVSVSMRTLE